MEKVVEEEDEEEGELEKLKSREVEEDNLFDGGSENGGGEVKEKQRKEKSQMEL